MKKVCLIILCFLCSRIAAIAQVPTGPTFETISASGNEGAYTWKGTTYTACGNYTYTSTNAGGFPHVETLKLSLFGKCCTPWLIEGNSANDCQSSVITSTNNIMGIKETNINPLRIFTNNAEQVRILSTGEVGIQHQTPTASLDIRGKKVSLNERNFRVVSFDGGNNGFNGNLINTELSGLTNSQAHVPGIGWTALFAKQGNANKAGTFVGDVTIMNDVNLNGNGSTPTGTLGIGTITPSTRLHIAAPPSGQPIRVEGLNVDNDTELVTTDASGVFHKRAISSLSTGVMNSCITVNNVPRVNATSGNIGCSQITDNLDKVGINTPTPVAKFHVTVTNPLYNDGIMIENTGGMAAELDLKSYSASGQQVWGIRGSGSANARPRAFSIYDYSSAKHRFLIDSLGNVGIGTNTAIPGNRLEINSNIFGTSGLRLTNLTNLTSLPPSNGKMLTVDGNGDVILVNQPSNSSANAWEITGNTGITGVNNILGIKETNTNPLRIFTNNSEKMRITNNGNVGIGTNSPPRNLTVNNGMNIDQAEDNDGNDAIPGPTSLQNSLSFGNATSNTGEGIGSCRIPNSLNNPFGLDFYTFNQKRMLITHDGNVGIGTLSPLAKLEVENVTMRIAGDFTTSFANPLSNIGVRGRATSPSSNLNNYHGMWGLANNNNVRKNYGVQGDAIGHRDTSSQENCGGFFNARGIVKYNYGIRATVGNNGKYNYAGHFTAPYNNIGSVVTNTWAGYFQGDVKIVGKCFGTGYEFTSDSTLKKNIYNVSNALNTINQLHPKTYDFKANENPYLNLPTENQIGFLAQEVKNVLSNLVDSVNYSPVVDTNDNLVYSGGTYLSMNYIGIIPIAIAGIKELDTKVNVIDSLGIKSSCTLTTGFLPKASATDSVCNSLIYDNGSGIGIGTSTIPAAYKMVVEGKVGVRDLIVACPPSWPDYVFSENHSLPTLNEVESFVTANKHLPGIPSANEIEKGGINVGEMQTKQMEKIEELYLYIIEMNKSMKQLALENSALKERVKSMEHK